MPSTPQAVTETLFWMSVAVLFYAYAGYPVLMGLLSRVARRPPTRLSSELPRVTLFISAYNEVRVIEEKLNNSLALDYPHERLEIMVISDCSDDGTDEAVRRFASRGVRLMRQTARLGKSAGLNLGVPQASGDVLVFSDANAMYRPDAIRQLVKHFGDPKVGYVVGNARYLAQISDTQASESEGLYWKLETWLKKKESAFYSVVGGDCALYAIPRQLYIAPLPAGINDFLIRLQIIDRRLLGIFEPAAVCYEEAAGTFSKEFRRRVRIISRSLNALANVPGILNPFRHFR